MELNVDNNKYNTSDVRALFIMLTNAVNFNGIDLIGITKEYTDETLLGALQSGKDIGFNNKTIDNTDEWMEG